jgi:hypothetical protein
MKSAFKPLGSELISPRTVKSPFSCHLFRCFSGASFKVLTDFARFQIKPIKSTGKHSPFFGNDIAETIPNNSHLKPGQSR